MKAFGNYKKTMRRKLYGVKSLRVHRMIVEAVLGYSLDSKIEIHHVDYNRANNEHSNLVVCPNKSYHKLLHYRTLVYDSGYDPNFYLKCTDCKEFKLYQFFSINKTRVTDYHNICKPCNNLRGRLLYASRRIQS